jgi:hypothetical protein
MKKSSNPNENFALYGVLLANNCKIEIPVTNPPMTEEEALKEAIQMIEAWSHEHNNGTDAFIEFTIAKKIELFANNGPKTVKFFGEFLTHLIYTGDKEDWELFKKLFGSVSSKKLVKYMWTTRFNILSYLNKKDFLYKSLKKLYVSTEQAANLSPKFFPKRANEIMEAFISEINSNSIKIRNKDVISVSRWMHLLIEQFLADNPTSISTYHNSKKESNEKNGFIAKCFQDFEHIDTQQKEVQKIIAQKKEEEKTKPKDLYKGIYHAHAGNYEIRQVINKGNSTIKPKKVELEKGGPMTDMEKKSFAVNTNATYNLKKGMKANGGETQSQGFSAYFAKTPKPFLKSFREHENYAKRALAKDMDINKKYDLTPEADYIAGAFRNCVVQKNRGKFDAIYN